jgi:alkanesulfonate monooxygenase SsuD/methylene tetrahydromethanopterin reductase-like flavin-dependent oxidoreductase (luciferase family)
MRATLNQPAGFYEPIVTFASLIGATSTIRFMISVLAFPMREPVLLAKQIATLDILSGGRVMLGIGVGAYRDEILRVRPELQGANRGTVLAEGLQALRRLFDEPVASLDGRYLRFRDVDLAPKPLQRPFPLLASGWGDVALRRIAELADGWIAAAEGPDVIAECRTILDRSLLAAGRDPARFETHNQIWLCTGTNRADAEERLRRSQHFRRMLAHASDHSESVALEHYVKGNLLGTPLDVIDQIRGYEQAGVTHLGIIPIGDTMDDLRSDLELLAAEVLPAFAATV